MLGFLFVDEDDVQPRPGRRREAARRRRARGRRRPRTTRSRRCDHWSTAAIEEALRAALVEGLGLKPRNAFGPVRVAVTGRRISPPLFESLELLGRDRAAVGRGSRRRVARRCSRTAGRQPWPACRYHAAVPARRRAAPGHGGRRRRTGRRTTCCCAAAGRRLVASAGRHRCLAVGMVLVLPLLLMLPFVVYYAATGRRRRRVGDPAGRPRRPDAGRRWPTSTSRWPALIPVTWLSSACLHGLRPRWLASVAAAALARSCSSASGWPFVALVATLLVVGAAAASRRRRRDGRRAQRLHQHDPRLPARRAAPDPAAGRGGGVRLPRLPRPGVRRVRSRSRRSRSVVVRRCCSRSPTASARTRRSSSTGSRSALVAGTLVILTGGLEAGIAMHVLNNWLAFGAGARVRRHGLGAQPDRRHLVEHPGDPHPVAGLPRRWRGGWPGGWASQTTTDPAVLEAPERPRVRFLARLAGARRPARTRGPVTPVGYGVIGSTTGSGPVSLGSSPSIPAKSQSDPCREPGFGPSQRLR